MKKFYCLALSRAILFLLALIGITAQANAQVSVTATAGTVGPTAYTTLKGAFDAVNGGTHQGAITINITAATTETATAILRQSGYLGASSYTSVAIRPSGGSFTVGGNLTTLVELNNADNVTITQNGANRLTFDNASATGTTLTVRTGADNNRVEYCTLKSSGTSTGGSIKVGTSTGLVIDNCTFSESGATLPDLAINLKGFSTDATINNVTISNCLISNYKTAGIDGTNTSLGATTINANKFFQAASLAPASTHCAIYIGAGGGGACNITNNVIGGNASDNTGTYTLTASDFAGIRVAPGLTHTVTGNTIKNISHTGASTNFYGIDVQTNASATVGGASAALGNTITDISVVRSGTIGICYLINYAGSGTIQYNTIKKITSAGNGTTGKANTWGIVYTGSTTTTIANNTIGGSAADKISVTGNSSASTLTHVGIAVNGAGATISNNTIAYLESTYGTGSASCTGIFLNSVATTATITQNQINNLTNTVSNGRVSGIYTLFGDSNFEISRNFIHTLTASGAASTQVEGIFLDDATAGTTGVMKVINNIVAIDDAGITAYGIVDGIASTNTTATFKIYNNTVYIAGSHTTSKAFWTASQAIRDIRGNVFNNESTGTTIDAIDIDNATNIKDNTACSTAITEYRSGGLGHNYYRGAQTGPSGVFTLNEGQSAFICPQGGAAGGQNTRDHCSKNFTTNGALTWSAGGTASTNYAFTNAFSSLSLMYFNCTASQEVFDDYDGTTRSGTTKIGATHGAASCVPPVASITPDSPSSITCANTDVVLTATPATGVTYSWAGGGTSATKTVTTAGIYTVTVALSSDAACTATATYQVTSNITAPATPTISPAGTSFCASATLTGACTTVGATLAWSAAPTGNPKTVVISGTYTVIATDPTNGCTATAAKIVTISSAITASLTGANLTCAATNTTITATPSGATAYAWSAGATDGGSNTATVTTAGTYTVTVTSGACTSTSTIAITGTAGFNPAYTVSPGATTTQNTSVTYTVPSGGSNYTWTVPGTAGTDYTITAGGIGTGSNTVTLTWLTTGNKTVTINYNNGTCTGISAASNTTNVTAASCAAAAGTTTFN